MGEPGALIEGEVYDDALPLVDSLLRSLVKDRW